MSEEETDAAAEEEAAAEAAEEEAGAEAQADDDAAGAEAEAGDDAAAAPDVLRPGPDTPAEPYWAIMHDGDDGRADGNVWSFGNRLMLFFDRDIGERLMKSFSKAGKITYVLHGVTEAHLAKLQQIAENSELEVFVALKIVGRSIEAIPVEEHLAEAPPELPPPPG